MAEENTQGQGQARQRPRKMARRFGVYEHFTCFKDPQGKDKARCRYCDLELGADTKNGTSNLRTHVRVCNQKARDAASHPTGSSLPHQLQARMAEESTQRGHLILTSLGRAHMAEENAQGPGGPKEEQTEREMKPRSDVWPHFDRFKDDEDGKKKARCKRCQKVLLAIHGTRSLWKHVQKCCGGWGGSTNATAAAPAAAAATAPAPAAQASDGATIPDPQPATHQLSPAQMHLIEDRLNLHVNAALRPRARPMKSAGPVPPAMAPQQLYRGVRERHCVKWEAEIELPCNRTPLWLGSFDTAEDAALAYDHAAYRLRGEEARLNFPDNAASRAPLDPSVDAKLKAIFAAAPSSSKNAGAKKKAMTINLEEAPASPTNSSSDEGSGSGLDDEYFQDQLVLNQLSHNGCEDVFLGPLWHGFDSS